MKNQPNKFRRAVLGTAAGLGLLLATSCGTQKMTSTYGLPSSSVVDTSFQTEQVVDTINNIIEPTGINYFEENVEQDEVQLLDSSVFGTSLNARKVMSEEELRELRETLYPTNTNLNLGAEVLYLKPVLNATNDTTAFVLGAVSPDYKYTRISKEEGVDLLNRNTRQTPSQNVVSENMFTGEPVKVKYNIKSNFGLGLNPTYSLNGFGLGLDANIFNFLVSAQTPVFNSDLSQEVKQLADYENQTKRSQNGDMNLTYVTTTTDNAGVATQDFDWGFGAGYQLPVGNWRFGLTVNGKHSNINISESSQEVSKEIFSTIDDSFQGYEDATLWSESNDNKKSGWYAGGNARVSYVFNNGLELGANGSLLFPLKGIKEFDFDNSKVQTDKFTDVGFMVRYNF